MIRKTITVSSEYDNTYLKYTVKIYFDPIFFDFAPTAVKAKPTGKGCPNNVARDTRKHRNSSGKNAGAFWANLTDSRFFKVVICIICR